MTVDNRNLLNSDHKFTHKKVWPLSKMLSKLQHLVCHDLSMSRSSGLSSQCDVQVIITETGDNDVNKLAYQKPAYVAVALIMAMTAISVFFPMILSSLGMTENIYTKPPPALCPDPCRVTLVESIPQNLTYAEGSPIHLSTYEGWLNLLSSANATIDVAAFYWTLRGKDLAVQDPSDWQGERIFQELLKAGKERHIKIRIAQSESSSVSPNLDTEELAKQGAAEVRSLNFSQWFGSGVLHTKMMIVDDRHFYVGSANMDWRSLTQVKELGAVLHNCSCLALDAKKIFEVYWYLGKPDTPIPPQWPESWATKYNRNNTLPLSLNGTKANAYLASSPGKFCTRGRTSDIDAILDVIDKAKKFIHIAVMDYFPTTLYTRPRRFWPVIDDALRRASLERGVRVRVLASWWSHSRPDLPIYLRSLADLSGAMHAQIQVKLFQVPAFTPAQHKIPFARVNHNKYMVTESIAYIGTSNWAADYFISTAGVGLVINQTETAGMATNSTGTPLTLQQQLAAVFERDWNSTYAMPVKDSPAAREKKHKRKETRIFI